MADPNQALSSEDLSALMETQQHLASIGDPRADKVKQFLSSQISLPGASPTLLDAASSNPALLKSAAPTQFEQERNPDNQAGYLESLGHILRGYLHPSGGQNPYPGMGLDQKQEAFQHAQQADQNRVAAGRSVPYRIAATLGSVITDPEGMEHAADIGNRKAIAGIATGSALANVAPIAIDAAVKSGVPQAAARAGTELVQKGAEALSNPRELVGKAASAVRNNPITNAAIGPNPEAIPPADAFIKATKPRNSIKNVTKTVQTALPDARRAADSLGIDIDNMNLPDAEKAVTQAKKDVWQEFQSNYLDPSKDVSVNANPVAQRIQGVVDNMSPIQKRRLGSSVDDITAAANDYSGKSLSVDQIENRIQELNNELRSQQAQYKVNEQALRRDPRYAYKFAELDGLRQLESSAFDQVGAPELKQRYGALKTLDDVISRRIPVVERQNPAKLYETAGRMQGVGDVVSGVLGRDVPQIGAGLAKIRAGKNAQMLNDPDFLVQSAFKKTTPTPKPVLRQILNGEYMPQEGDASQFTPGYQGKQLPSGQPRVDQLPAGQYDAQPSALEQIMRPRQPQLQKAPTIPASRQLPAKGAIPLGPSGTTGATNIEPVGLPSSNGIVAPEGQAVANAITKGAKPKQFQPQSSSNPLPFLKTQEPAPAQTGKGFLDLLNKSVNGNKRNAALDELISTHGLVPRGYAPEYGGYGIGIPKGEGKFNDTVVPVNEITPERLQELKSNGTANPKGTPAPKPADVADQQRFRLSQLQNDLAKSNNPTERAELQSAIEQIQNSLPKRNPLPRIGAPERRK